MKKNNDNVMAVTTGEKRGADKKHTANKLKRGWNWEYAFSEKILSDGSRGTLVVEYMLHQRKFGMDVIVSNYPGGHQYEDATFEAIGDAFREFFQEAHEEGVAWKEVRERCYFTAWLIDAPIDSDIIRSFAAALEAINRVSVKVNDPTVGKKEE